MKNITVLISDEAYRKARIKASELNTLVSALVREFLLSLDAGEAEFDLRKKLQDGVLASVKSFRARDPVNRDEIHDRDESEC